MWNELNLARSQGFNVDSLKSSRPVEFEVATPEEAEEMFDVLTYQKGSTVLRMFETFIGEENFKKVLTTVRFRATENIYRFLREELKRYPINQIRFAKNSSAVFNDRWKDPGTGNFNLEIIKDDTHPYPIEIDLPKWTVQEDIDFRRWLLGFREGIVVESPAEFVDEIKLNILNLQGLYGIKK